MNACTQQALIGYFLELSPLLTHALIKLKPKDCNSPSKHATNAKDAEMQKLQEYIKQIKKDALAGAVMWV